MTERRLPGGRSFGAVRVGDEVRRPAQPWTATVHSVLRHLEDAGFDGAPRARGFDDQGRERLTFLPGQTLGETRRGRTGYAPTTRCGRSVRGFAGCTTRPRPSGRPRTPSGSPAGRGSRDL